MDLSGGFPCVPLMHVSAFVVVPYCFNHHSFIIEFEIRKNDVSNFVLSQGCYSRSFVVPNKF